MAERRGWDVLKAEVRLEISKMVMRFGISDGEAAAVLSEMAAEYAGKAIERWRHGGEHGPA